MDSIDQLAFEVKEWVVDLCFEVVGALDLTVHALNPNVDWRTRGEAYLQLLRAYLQNAIDNPDL